MSRMTKIQSILHSNDYFTLQVPLSRPHHQICHDSSTLRGSTLGQDKDCQSQNTRHGLTLHTIYFLQTSQPSTCGKTCCSASSIRLINGVWQGIATLRRRYHCTMADTTASILTLYSRLDVFHTRTRVCSYPKNNEKERNRK